ncbi:hypothetical protein Poli38472_012421 [Pythium oligandrum]|uniref:Uncharacterized protein n=1 Tax=Pythium oligandrum TaxID=41045 RepID=A0A8K1FKN3_PYTOL|nr:hypothetical protein Poli38472_012421 [Pythium oligandrum]|eukprot:TMW67305.1 hypothetical protein Poli38472_012421 [Pythium oligandrum]
MASSPRVLSCRFFRFSCDHELFQARYTRSNRTKGTKIMRCFPHCCPEHLPRCYCGCSLHILVTFEDVSTIAASTLVVCARFETEADASDPRRQLAQEIRIPQALTRPHGYASNKEESQWVLAERESEMKQEQMPKNSVLFVMNHHRFPRWYYGYESGATKNQREMRHHLVAYVLDLRPTERHRPQHGMVPGRIIGRLKSPGFLLLSYRRAGTTATKTREDTRQEEEEQQEEVEAAFDPDEQSSTEEEAFEEGENSLEHEQECDSPAPQRLLEVRAAQAASSPAPSTPSQPRQSFSSYVESKASTRSCSSVEGTPSRKHSAPLYRESPPRRSEPAESRLAWWQKHRAQLQKIRHICVIYVLLDHLGLHDISYCISGKSDRLRSHWLESVLIAAASDRECARQMAATFDLKCFAEDLPFVWQVSSASAQTVLSICVELLLHVVTTPSIERIVFDVFEKHQDHVLEREQLQELFMSCVTRLYGQLNAILNRGREASGVDAFGSLVDEVVTTVFREEKFVAIRKRVKEELSDSTQSAERFFQWFIAQMRLSWVQYNERKASGMGLLWQAMIIIKPTQWQGTWVVDSSSYRARRPGGFTAQNTAPSVLTVLGWVTALRRWMALEISVDEKTCYLRSVLARTSQNGTKLILDGRERVCNVFPDGLVTTFGDDGAVAHGDYVGHGSADSPELFWEMYSPSRQEETVRLERVSVRVTIKPDVRERSAVVRLRLSTASHRSSTQDSFATLPSADRHAVYRSVEWTAVMDAQITFHRIR